MRQYVFISRDPGTFGGRAIFYNWNTTRRNAEDDRRGLANSGCAVGPIVCVPVPAKQRKKP